MTTRLLIRVDGSPTIGMGHVMRCLSLARVLSQRAALDVRFVMRTFPNALTWVTAQGYPAVPLPAACSAEEEVRAVQALLSGEETHGLITDLRAMTPGLVECAKTEGLLTVMIDEWGGCAATADILTNGTIVPAWHRYQVDGDVRCCIGPAYALLDQQFFDCSSWAEPVRRDGSSVLVALGGDDPFFLTVVALRALERLSRPLSGTVVIGPAFTNQEEIRQMAARSRYRWEVRENATDMAALMRRADVALTGGGLIALELACAGVPGMILCEASHQLETADVLARHGAAVDLGFGVAVPEEPLARAVDALLGDADRRGAMAQAGRRLIDGKGCSRLAEVILHALTRRETIQTHGTIRVPVGR